MEFVVPRDRPLSDLLSKASSAYLIVWPNDSTHESRAAWYEREASYWRELECRVPL